MKKWLAILLATVLVLGLGTAMAAQQELDGTTTTTGAIALQTTPTVTQAIKFLVTYGDAPTYTYTWSTAADGTDGKYHWTMADQAAKTIAVNVTNQGSETKTVKATWAANTAIETSHALTSSVDTTAGTLFKTAGISLAANAATATDTITVSVSDAALKNMTSGLTNDQFSLGDLTITIE